MSINPLGSSYAMGVSNQINQVMKDLAETNKIVLDIFKKLDEYKATVDKEIVKEAIKKAEEKIEKLNMQITKMTPQLRDAIGKIQDHIDELKKQLQISV